MKKLELGAIFNRDDELYEVLGIIDNERVIISAPVGNRIGFKKYDVERSLGFQRSIKPVKTIIS